MTTVTESKLPTLYNLAEQYAFLLDLDMEGFEEAVAQLGGELTAKSGAILMVIRTLEGRVKDFKAEEERLEARRKAMANRIAGLKEYIKVSLQVAGLKSIDVGTFSATVQDSPPSCEVVDADAIPAKFRVKVPATWKTDAKAIIAAFKASGEQVRGAFVKSGTHLVIR